jgi:hypothetical protein
MNMKQIRAMLARANLSEVARKTGLNLRTLRRIRNNDSGTVMLSTALKLERLLKDQA